MKKANMNTKNKQSASSSPFKINNKDAFHLVGGVIEKAFSNQTNTHSSFPAPSILPFSVARHRYHGPYWNPIPNKVNSPTDDDIEDDEELSRYNTIAGLANPPQRKEKRGLDFSKVRKIMNNQSNYVASPDGNGVSFVESKSKNNFNGLGVTSDKSIKENVNAKMAYNQPELLEDVMEVDEGSAATFVSHTDSASTPSIHVNEEGGMSVESQIDAENRAKLEKMSADQISEAHGEIISTLRPELIDALRRRGQENLKCKNDVGLDAKSGSEVNKMESEKGRVKASTVFVVGSSDKDLGEKLNGKKEVNKDLEVKLNGKKEVNKDLEGTLNGKKEVNAGPLLKSSSLWDSWTTRVEGVRKLRFNIDGNIVEGEYNPSCLNHSEDNEPVHDYIRTDGDLGAAGCSFKEAVALCQSMVPGQRALALHLIASVDGAVRNILQNPVGDSLNHGVHGSIDWGAIWDFALGPEPDLALALRMCIDDNHSSVVLACAKVIESCCVVI